MLSPHTSTTPSLPLSGLFHVHLLIKAFLGHLVIVATLSLGSVLSRVCGLLLFTGLYPPSTICFTYLLVYWLCPHWILSSPSGGLCLFCFLVPGTGPGTEQVPSEYLWDAQVNKMGQDQAGDQMLRVSRVRCAMPR